MIGALISLLSLEMTARLIQKAHLVAVTLTIAGATNATPVVVQTQNPHNFTRPAHGIVSGVGGNAAANGLWVLTPTDSTHFALTTFDAQGNVVQSVGTGTYTTGGQIQIAFPDGSILLGRRNVAMASAVATPRIVFVPIGSPSWSLSPYGGILPAPVDPPRPSAEGPEKRYMLLNRQLVSEKQRFEVYVTGCANPPDPDFGDFDMTQGLYQTLYGVMFDKITPDRVHVLGGRWVSQEEGKTSLDVRGHQWMGVVEIEQPVVDQPLQFVPAGTVGEIDVNLANASSTEAVVITLPPVTP